MISQQNQVNPENPPSASRRLLQIVASLFCFPAGLVLTVNDMRGPSPDFKRLGRTGLALSLVTGILCVLPFLSFAAWSSPPDWISAGTTVLVLLAAFNFFGMLLCFPLAMVLYIVDWKKPGFAFRTIKRKILDIGILAVVLLSILAMMVPGYLASRRYHQPELPARGSTLKNIVTLLAPKYLGRMPAGCSQQDA